jgi:copper(I)-binding protein
MQMAHSMIAALIAALWIGINPAAQAQTVKVGDIEIAQPWSRATPQGSKVGAGYLILTNRGARPDRLVSATTSVAGTVELHEMAMEAGVMKMRQIAGGIPLEPGKTVTLAPGGLHIMFIGLTGPLTQGQKFTARLVFEKAGPADVTFDVQAIGAKQSGGGHSH